MKVLRLATLIVVLTCIVIVARAPAQATPTTTEPTTQISPLAPSHAHPPDPAISAAVTAAVPAVHDHSAAPGSTGFFDDLLRVYMPRQMCMFYEGPVIWLHVVSDLFIALAYYSIPFALVYFVRRRKDVVFGSVFWMFAAFILACGTTHLLSLFAVWRPYYRIDGLIKGITAVLSVLTAVSLWKLMPQFLSIPSARILEDTVRTRTAELERVSTDRERLLLAERAAAAKAELQYRNFDAVLSSIVDYTFILDREGRFVYANRVLLELWGLPADQALGKTMKELNYTPDVEAQLMRNTRTVFETRGIVRDMTLGGTSSTATRHYEYVLSPVINDNNAVEFIAGLSRDITDRYRAELEREQLLARERSARAEAERASRLKDEFLATLSHELRTPLSAILGWSQLLRRPSINQEDLDEGLAVIERNARAQTKLIAELLDLSRIISGKLRIEVTHVNMAEVLADAVAVITPSAEAKGIRIQRSSDNNLGLIRGDTARLQQVFWNILSNSVKFTPPNGTISIYLSRAGDNARVTVTDTGQGITEDFLPSIFERFRQADGSTTRRYGGLGIGLSIVKSIVEAHGGQVSAASPGEGAGTTITVQIPIGERAPLNAPSVASATATGPNVNTPARDDELLAGLRILIVDDEPDAVGLASRILGGCNARVFTAASADAAFEVVRRERPDVMVSDIGMPGQDGYQLIARVRALDPAQGGMTPAAALTAFAATDDRRRALTAGFQAHVSKPLDAAELISVVATLTGRLRSPHA